MKTFNNLAIHLLAQHAKAHGGKLLYDLACKHSGESDLPGWDEIGPGQKIWDALAVQTAQCIETSVQSAEQPPPGPVGT